SAGATASFLARDHRPREWRVVARVTVTPLLLRRRASSAQQRGVRLAVTHSRQPPSPFPSLCDGPVLSRPCPRHGLNSARRCSPNTPLPRKREEEKSIRSYGCRSRSLPPIAPATEPTKAPMTSERPVK